MNRGFSTHIVVAKQAVSLVKNTTIFLVSGIASGMIGLYGYLNAAPLDKPKLFYAYILNSLDIESSQKLNEFVLSEFNSK